MLCFITFMKNKRNLGIYLPKTIEVKKGNKQKTLLPEFS